MKIRYLVFIKITVRVLISTIICLNSVNAISLSEQCAAINNWTINNKDVLSEQRLFAGERLPLFKQYPHLVNKIPYLALAHLPTPVNYLSNLGKKLGLVKIYLKNDAKTYDDFGGNKVRKLEFLLAHALVNKADVAITTGSAGSNHSTATISLCKAIGLPVASCLSAQRNTSYLRRNLLLSYLYGGALHHYDSEVFRQQGMIDRAAEYQKNGKKPYYIAMGGSVPRGALGYVNAAFELAEQIKNNLLPEPDTIILASCSNGSVAGLVLGLALVGLKSKVIAIGTEPMTPELFRAECNHLVAGMLELLELPVTTPVGDPQYVDTYVGDGYAALTQKTIDALSVLYESEKFTLDGTYAGKALGALIDYAQSSENKDKTILFWNTFCTGDFKDTIGDMDYKILPRAFHYYFESPLQPGDRGV